MASVGRYTDKYIFVFNKRVGKTLREAEKNVHVHTHLVNLTSASNETLC